MLTNLKKAWLSARARRAEPLASSLCVQHENRHGMKILPQGQCTVADGMEHGEPATLQRCTADVKAQIAWSSALLAANALQYKAQ